MSNKTSNKQKIDGDDGTKAKLSAMKSSKRRTVKHNEQATAMATSAARKQGGGAFRTAGRSSVKP